jgi:hypothetical protein
MKTGEGGRTSSNWEGICEVEATTEMEGVGGEKEATWEGEVTSNWRGGSSRVPNSKAAIWVEKVVELSLGKSSLFRVFERMSKLVLAGGIRSSKRREWGCRRLKETEKGWPSSTV